MMRSELIKRGLKRLVLTHFFRKSTVKYMTRLRAKPKYSELNMVFLLCVWKGLSMPPGRRHGEGLEQFAPEHIRVVEDMGGETGGPVPRAGHDVPRGDYRKFPGRADEFRGMGEDAAQFPPRVGAVLTTTKF